MLSICVAVPAHFFQIPYVVEGRREGDVASCYADVSLAEKELGWKAERNLDDMCKYLCLI